MTISPQDITLQDIVKFAPIVTFHRDEGYYPVSIDFLAQNSNVCNADGTVFIQSPTPAQLATVTDSTKYLSVGTSAQNGMPPANKQIPAPMYVCPQVDPDGNYVDLSFLMLFGYNGSQAVYVRPPVLSNFDCAAATFAEHQGDIECVTVRVDPGFQKIILVRLEAHGDSSWETPAAQMEVVNYANPHPLVRAAYNAHGTYNGYGQSFPARVTLSSNSVDLGIGTVGVDIVDLLDPFPVAFPAGPVWQPFAVDGGNNEQPNGQLVIIGFSNGVPFNDQTWISFPGRFGGGQANSFQGVVELPSEPIDSAQEAVGNAFGNAAQDFGLIPEDDLQGEGPSPFLGRPTTDVNNPFTAPITGGLVWGPDHLIPNSDNANGLSGSPAAIVFNGQLLVLHEGQGDSGWMLCATFDGGSWGPDTSIPDNDNAYGTSGAPGLAVYNGVLYIIHEGRDDDNQLWCATYDGWNWGTDTPLSFWGQPFGTLGTPALAVFNGLLYVIRLALDPNTLSITMLCTTFDGNAWASDVTLPFTSINNQPALVVYQDALWCFYESPSGTVSYAYLDAQGNWNGQQPVPNQTLGTSGLAAVVFDNKIYCLREQADNDGWIVGCVFDDGVWTGDALLPDSSNAYGTSGAPALAVFNDVLFNIRQGRGDSGWMWCSTAFRAF
ncbi:MAG: hypothetical protein QOD64_1713 [Verrucomicrobiota bacterium]